MTRFDKDEAPDFSQLGQPRNERHSKYDAYDSRPDAHINRDSHRQSDNTDSSFSAVRERVQVGIATSHSHTEALQDLVLSLSEGTSRRDAESDKSVLKDLVKEMLTFRCNACCSPVQILYMQSCKFAYKCMTPGQCPIVPSHTYVLTRVLSLQNSCST